MKKIILLIILAGISYGIKAQSYTPLHYSYNGTPTHGIKIKTNLPYQSYAQMPTIIIEGYNFGKAKSIGIILNWYIYKGNFHRYVASNHGAFSLPIKLANENGKVVIFIDSKEYFNRFQVRAYAHGMSQDIAKNYEGWVALDEPLKGTNIVTVPYNTNNQISSNPPVFSPVWTKNSNNDINYGLGNVGIGTLNPSAGLEIVKNEGVKIKSEEKGNIGGTIKMIDGGGYNKDNLLFSSPGGFVFKMDKHLDPSNKIEGFNIYNRNNESIFTISEETSNITIPNGNLIMEKGNIITENGDGSPGEVLSIDEDGNMEWNNMINISNAYTGVYEINSGFVYRNTPSNYGTILISNLGPTLITGINPGVHGQKITIHVKSASSTLVLRGDDDNTIENKKIHIQELENSASLDGKNSISLIEGNSATLMYDTNINKWRLIDRNINFDISGKQLALYENGKIKNSPVKISKDDNLFIGMPEAFEVPHKVNVNGSINATGLFVNGNPVDGSIDGMVIENNPGTKTVEMKLTQGVQDQYFLQAYYDNTVSGGGITSIQGTKQNSGKISLSKMNNTSLIELGHSGNSNQMTIVYGELCVSTDQSSCDVPDYVFEDDYDLMPIKDVATFIKKNKHLPNVPSEKEIKEKGKLDMMSFSYKLLEKVEELTLYTIDQENRLKKLDDLVTKQAELIEKLLKK